MEVGDQRVDNMPLIARININLRPVSSGLHFSCNACRLQRPYGGRAYRNDPASLCFRPVDSGSGFRGHAVKFSVHGVVFNIFFRNRTKRAQPYIQSDKHFFTAHVFDFLQKFFCKMQACSRRRSRPRIPVVNCLIPFLVFQFFRNIRWQRHFSQPVQDFFEHSFKGKTDNTSAKIRMVNNRPGQLVREIDMGPHLQFFSGTHQHFPVRIVQAGQQKHFYMGPGILKAVQAGRNHTGIIKDQQIAGF